MRPPPRRDRRLGGGAALPEPDEAAAGAVLEQRPERGELGLARLGLGAQELEPVLQHRAQARIAPRRDQPAGEARLRRGERDRRLDRHARTPSRLNATR
jgi:hypothetical protein